MHLPGILRRAIDNDACSTRFMMPGGPVACTSTGVAVAWPYSLRSLMWHVAPHKQARRCASWMISFAMHSSVCIAYSILSVNALQLTRRWCHHVKRSLGCT
jgi:hypothetical protein